MSVESPVQRNPRDINGNDLGNEMKSEPFEEIENGKRKLPIVIVPEPKRAMLHHETPASHKSERESPVKDYGISREFPAYPQFHWPTPFYAGFPHQYPFLPYRLHGFPMAAFPESFSMSSYQEHVNAYNTQGAIIAPFPFMAGISPYQFPLPFRQAKCAGREFEKNEIETNVKSAFESVANSSKCKTEPVDLSSQSNGKLQQCDKKKNKDGEQAKYQCEDCQKSYSTFSGLSKHKQFHCTHELNKEFACKYCDKTYLSLGALKMHIRTHTLPCKCKICGKAFSRPWLLQGHIRTHTGEKPFSCVHCLRAFADRSNLRAHLQTHSDVKKYSCKACNKTFSRMSLLLKHEDSCTMVDV